MKVAIIGHGFVGKAIEYVILKNKCDVTLIDLLYKNSISDYTCKEFDVIFVCLPTPMSNDGSINDKIIKDEIGNIQQLSYKPLVIVKSTLLPNSLEDISKKIERIVYSPEFLTEKNAKNDLLESKFTIFAGNKVECEDAKSFFIKNTKCKSSNFIFTDFVTASLVKYTINSFLASKVIFFNEIYNLSKSIDENFDWSMFTSILVNDRRIGSSHLEVPGHDKRFGFGGACFPKDTKALLKFSESKNTSLELLEKVIKINDEIRSKYSTITERESTQNIKFNE